MQIKVPQRLIHKMVDYGGDAAAGLLTLSVLQEGVPIALGVLGFAWFVLRFVNFWRVNYKGKDPWWMG